MTRYGRLPNSVQVALGLISLIGLLLRFFWYESYYSKKHDRPTLTELETRRRPREIPTGPATKLPKARAVARFPALAQAGSPLNRAFLDLVERCRAERPEVFDDPEWPTVLAAEAARLLR